MACCLSMGTTMVFYSNNFNSPSASLSLITGSRSRNSVSINVKPKAPSFALSFSSSSSFAGSSLGLALNSNIGTVANRWRGLVVKAAKYLLCQTKRNRSRKSLARTHGFRRRMSTTSGRAVIKRRRAKGRWNLCTKTNPSSGKRA